MSLLRPVVGEFGAARITFIDGDQRIPPDLMSQFALLTLIEPHPKLGAEWLSRLETSLGVTDKHRRMAERGPVEPNAPWAHGLSRDVLKASFAEYFGLGAEYVEILVVLYERPRQVISLRRLRYLVNAHRPPTNGAIYERIRVLREVMEAESIDSGGPLDASGYNLTEVGYEECRHALVHMGEVLKRHGDECGEVLSLPARPDVAAAPELRLGRRLKRDARLDMPPYDPAQISALAVAIAAAMKT